MFESLLFLTGAYHVQGLLGARGRIELPRLPDSDQPTTSSLGGMIARPKSGGSQSPPTKLAAYSLKTRNTPQVHRPDKTPCLFLSDQKPLLRFLGDRRVR